MTPRERELVRQLRGDWPQPDPAAIEVSLALIERMTAAMAEEGGSIGFDRYMAMALYEPGLGYYSAGMARFGPGGDFITAPLVSGLFSRTLARQCAECLSALGGGVILELGAGTGRMAADILNELGRLQAPPERYFILEVSAALRQQQRETLEREAPAWLERVEWLDRLPAEPIRGVLLANEVIDALPVRRFRLGADGARELRVALEGERFVWREADNPAVAADIDALRQRLPEPLPAGYASEYCAGLGAWLGSLADALAAGVMLFFDYGYPRREYYHPQRGMGTLVCHYRHRAHPDPLILPGLQDITAFVDFSAVAEAGMAAGLELLGFAPQAQFLFGAGLLELMQEAAAGASERDNVMLAQQVKTLTMPGEMGERFKVLAFGRGYDAGLRGFAYADQRGRL